MPRANFLTGLDIGTGTIKILAVKKTENGLEVISQIEENSAGIRRGVVVDVEEVSNILKNAFSQLRGETGQKIDSVYVSIDGSHLFSAPSHGIISVSRADQKISEEDIQRVLQAAQTFSCPPIKKFSLLYQKNLLLMAKKE